MELKKQATDRNGVTIVNNQIVKVHQDDGVRIAVVSQRTGSPTVNENGEWVDVDFGGGPEGMPSYLLEVIGMSGVTTQGPFEPLDLRKVLGAAMNVSNHVDRFHRKYSGISCIDSQCKIASHELSTMCMLIMREIDRSGKRELFHDR